MNVINRWRENRPSGARLYALLALVVIFALVIGGVIFIWVDILPQWQSRNDRATQLIEAKQRLQEADEASQSPEVLREQLADTQAAIEETTSLFLTDSQAAEIMGNLYTYAEESDVQILDLQYLTPSDDDEEDEEKEEKKDLYDANTFRLDVIGSIQDLIAFITRIEEASSESLVISNVEIERDSPNDDMEIDVTLYTSPYSSGVTDSANVPPTTIPTSVPQLEMAWARARAEEDWDRVIFLLEQILTMEPDYEDGEEKLYIAHVNYGLQLLDQGNDSDAIDQFNQALKIKPGGEEALAGLVQAAATPTPTPTVTTREILEQDLAEAWEDEQWEEAVDLIGQILALDPDEDNEEMTEKLYAAYVNYGYELIDEGELEEAKEAFGQALSVNPEGGEAARALQQLASGTPTPAPTATPSVTYVTHTVQAGENLFRIALRYDTTVEAIKQANGLTDNNIYVGQVLRIPQD